MQSNSARRMFVKTGIAAIATARFPILGANDVSVGIVGLGGRGRNHINYYSPHSNPTAASSRSVT